MKRVFLLTSLVVAVMAGEARAECFGGQSAALLNQQSLRQRILERRQLAALERAAALDKQLLRERLLLRRSSTQSQLLLSDGCSSGSFGQSIFLRPVVVQDSVFSPFFFRQRLFGVRSFGLFGFGGLRQNGIVNLSFGR